MGGAMAARLAAAGNHLVVWNRDRAKAESAAGQIGAAVAATPAEAAGASSTVLTSLADDAALRAVYLDDEGIVAGVRPGSLVIDTSTVDPGTVHDVGARVDAAGAGFLDCPVSGSVSTVEAGALVVMAGGEPELVRRAEPLLASIAKQIVHIGPRGTGAACKLAVNALVHGLNISLSEALVLAEKSGVAREIAYEVLAGGAGGAPFVHYKRAAFEHPDQAAVAFSLDLVAKDLDLITHLAEAVGAPMAQAAVGREIVAEAIGSGMGDHDMSAIAVHLRERGA